MLLYVCLGMVAGVLFLVHYFLGIKKDSSEPPFIPSKVPYFGHLAGVLFHRTHYLIEMSKKHQHPIFSLAMPAGRLYVIASPELISAVQKQPRTLTFWFIQASLTQRLGGISDKANELLLENARGEKGQNSLVVDGMKVTHDALRGSHLDNLTIASIQRADRLLNGLASNGGGTKFDLWKWVRHVFSLAVSAGVYGPLNPYEEPTLEQDLQDYARQTLMFLTGLPPRLLIPSAYSARERIVTAFEKYFDNGGFETGSELVRARRNILQAYGIHGQDIARFETVNGFGILLNLLPTAFWTIWHILSEPSLLNSVREEAHEYLKERKWTKAETKAEDELPMIASTMREVLRYHVAGASTRMVMEDHRLNGQYLLKKDSMIQMPNVVPHFDVNEWGPDADKFDAYRFIRHEGRKPHPAAFRGWGGGANLCPGRIYSPRLILTVTAMLLDRFDVRSLAEGGGWDYPGHDQSNPAIAVVQPKKSTMVELFPQLGK